jgi:hypothetical protein
MVHGNLAWVSFEIFSPDIAELRRAARKPLLRTASHTESAAPWYAAAEVQPALIRRYAGGG